MQRKKWQLLGWLRKNYWTNFFQLLNCTNLSIEPLYVATRNCLIGNRQFISRNKTWSNIYMTSLSWEMSPRSQLSSSTGEKRDTPLNLIYVNCFIISKVKETKKKMSHEKRTLQRRRIEKCINPSTGHNCFITVSTHIPLTT